MEMTDFASKKINTVARMNSTQLHYLIVAIESKNIYFVRKMVFPSVLNGNRLMKNEKFPVIEILITMLEGF